MGAYFVDGEEGAGVGEFCVLLMRALDGVDECCWGCGFVGWEVVGR